MDSATVRGTKAAALIIQDANPERRLGLRACAADINGAAIIGALHQREPALPEVPQHGIVSFRRRAAQNP